MAEPFDPSVYVRPPVVDVPAAYSLGVALLAAVPGGEDRDSRARRAARTLRGAVVNLRDAWTARVKLESPDRRGFDVVADSSWRALSWALQSVALVSGTPEDDARATRARAAIAKLFPGGLEFTQLEFASQWAHADRVLAEIDAEALERELDDLVGRRYLAFVRRAHAAYGAALKITEPAELATVGVREPLRAVQVAIQEYVFALFAEHPPSDARNHSLLREALAPIDALRASQERGRTPSGGAPGAPAGPPGPAAPEPIGPPPEGPIPNVG